MMALNLDVVVRRWVLHYSIESEIQLLQSYISSHRLNHYNWDYNLFKLRTRDVCQSCIQQFWSNHRPPAASTLPLHYHHHGSRAGTYCLRCVGLLLCIHTGTSGTPKNIRSFITTYRNFTNLHNPIRMLQMI